VLPDDFDQCDCHDETTEEQDADDVDGNWAITRKRQHQRRLFDECLAFSEGKLEETGVIRKTFLETDISFIQYKSNFNIMLPVEGYDCA